MVDNMVDEKWLQARIEKIADEVTGLSTKDELLVLSFEIVGPRTFRATLNDTGPEVYVRFTADMEVATVEVTDVESRSTEETAVLGSSFAIASAIVNLVRGKLFGLDEYARLEMSEISRNRLIFAAVERAQRLKACAFCASYEETGAHGEACPVYVFDPPNTSGEPMDGDTLPSVSQVTMVTAEITAEAYTTTVWSNGEVISSRTMKITPTGAHAAQKGDFYDDFEGDDGDLEDFVETLESIDSAAFDVAHMIAGSS